MIPLEILFHGAKSRYLNSRIEQDHRRVRRRVRPMLGFESFCWVAAIFASIEVVHMMRKCRGRFAFNPQPSLKERIETVAALKCV